MRIIYKNPEWIVGHEKYVPENERTKFTADSAMAVVLAAGKWRPKCAGGKMINEIVDNSSEMIAAMEELAQKVVPTGLKYKIIKDSDLPADRDFRNAWDIDDAELTDGVGGSG